ncbi:helix-turn-helix domain-containing protein [Luteococcus sp. Sow4_B9]|uniref:helix-turn-helix domain-containing protein n=1 Tax=Luteococcus sp. Sow4_B9 TaxID=3438792 RepID=UPI003F979068
MGQGRTQAQGADQPGEADFAARLAASVQQRGLSLSRIRRRVEEMGLSVSEATLSYWCTGRSRPIRASSLEVVRALEIILGTEPGWLVAALPSGKGVHSLAGVISRHQLLEQAVQEHALATSADWRTIAVNYTVTVESDGWQRSTGTGYALKQQIRNLVVQVDFEGTMPRDFVATVQTPGDAEPVERAGLLRRGAHCVQAVLRDPGPGMYEVAWSWGDDASPS